MEPYETVNLTIPEIKMILWQCHTSITILEKSLDEERNEERILDIRHDLKVLKNLVEKFENMHA